MTRGVDWTGRAGFALPLLGVALLHAVAMNQPVVAALAAVGVVTGLARRAPTAVRPLRLGAAAAAGTVLGWAALSLSQPAYGSIPPGILSPTTGALLALMVASAWAHRVDLAWGSGGLVAALAVTAPNTVDLRLPGAVVAAALLVAIVLAGSAGRFRPRRFAALAALALVTTGVGATVAGTLAAGEGMVWPILAVLVTRASTISGLAAQTSVGVGSSFGEGQNTQVVFDVEGMPPETFRTQVLDHFDGNKWTVSETMAQGAVAQVEAGPSSRELELHFLSGLRGTVPAPAGLQAVDERPLEVNPGWVLRGATARGTVLHMRWSGQEELPPEPQPGPEYLEVPADLAAAMKPLADEIIGDASTPRAIASALELHLATRHAYSLRADLKGTEHPLVALVRERRAAFCVHFASAMAVMLRVEGIHARMVGGFAPWEVNAVTGRLLVRVRDSHAWVEAWLPEEGRWVAFDPTPSREEVLGVNEYGGLSAWFTGLQYAILRSVDLLRSDPMGALRAALTSWPFAVVLASGAGWALWRWRRGWLRRMKPEGISRIDPNLWPHYRRYQRILLKTLRIRPGLHDSDEDLVRRVAETGANTDELERFLAAYRRARYRRDRAEDLEALLDAVEATLSLP